MAADTNDYKALIAAAASKDEKLTLARKLGTLRLARSVLPELDRCFAALNLDGPAETGTVVAFQGPSSAA